MKNWFAPKKHKLDAAIDKLLIELETYDPDTEEYRNAMKHIDMLYKMKAGDSQNPISKDTLVIVGANLLGILIVIFDERTHVITSKAMSMVIKPKTP